MLRKYYSFLCLPVRRKYDRECFHRSMKSRCLECILPRAPSRDVLQPTRLLSFPTGVVGPSGLGLVSLAIYFPLPRKPLHWLTAFEISPTNTNKPNRRPKTQQLSKEKSSTKGQSPRFLQCRARIVSITAPGKGLFQTSRPGW